MKLKAAAVQFTAETAKVAANIRRAEALLEEAAAAGAELLVLPELWNCGYDPRLMSELPGYAEDMHGPSLTMLRQLASRCQVTVVGGSIVESKGGAIYNTSVLVDKSGHVAAKYRKVHLFTQYQREQDYFAAGDEWTLAEVAGENCSLKLGMTVCYDLRFPEFYRNLALRGAELFSVPSAWPAKRIVEHELLCRARADENRCYLISANLTGGVYNGRSLIVSPLGQVLARGDDQPGFILAELDMDIWSRHDCFRVFADRRQMLDEIDDNLL